TTRSYHTDPTGAVHRCRSGEGGRGGEADREAPGTPGAGRAVVHPGHAGTTVGTGAIPGQVVAHHLVPVPDHHGRAAAGTGGGLPVPVVHVAGVDVAQPVVVGDPPGPSTRRGRGRRYVERLEVEVERGDV